MAGKLKKGEASSSSRSGGGGGSNHRGESVVVDYGENKSSCGYCKSPARTSIAHGLWAHSITIDDYQDLLDRGWRRSGCFLYKPDMERTCCPAYTIRLRAGDFVPSKEQARVSRRMQRYLDGTLECKKPGECIENPNASKDTRSHTHPKVSSSAAKESCSNNNEEKGGEEKIMHYLSDQVDNAVRGCSENGEFPDIQFPKAIVKKVLQAKRKLLVEGSEDLLYSSNFAFQIAATIRRSLPGENDVHRGRLSTHITDEKGPSPKLIAEKLECYLNQLAKTSGLLVRACNGHLNFYSATKQASLYESAQTVNISKGSAAGSESKGCGVTHSSQNAPVKRRRLEIHLRRSSFDSEEYALYRRYQIAVHNDSPEHVTESSYKRFLVDTPLNYVPPKGDGTVPPCGFGSFHQQYVVDGKLVAVGVIDILPRCLSSKYLFWDPDFAFLSPGKYSALQEINWVKENQAHCSTLQYYYLGYYIHSCSKMRYKAAYSPSELLCPLRYQWIPFHIARPLLDKKRYAVLSDVSVSQDRESLPPHVSEEVMEVQHDDIGKEDTNDFPMYDDEVAIDFEYESSDNEQNLVSVDVEDGNIGNILIGLNGSRVRFKDIKFAFGSSERSYLEFQLHRYMRVVGEELAERMVYSLE
ncbi:LOW QUALITY PROTEIN: arginyl-tRNA--protein transferase 2 [Pyrus x bretschneideri]|uniref:LOW QUALITY PROTEIN: arginyl-tRNA--protein transferase 2 n=1 Tax=Pyrus x bretschneideri TaxID=225117 RepID=UPI0020301595|nr:LOW QUALITY PROTEIN: arginyl-tRNA--protein transferase 2 [Pyrus x bretschneideri]